MSIEELISGSEYDLKKSVLEREPEYWKPHFENHLDELCRIERPKTWMILSHSDVAFFETLSKQLQEKLIAPSLSELALRDFAERVSMYPTIEGVYVLSSDNVHDVWTVIEEFNDETEDKIAKAELQLVTQYPDFSFDFMLIRRNGRELTEILPEGSKPLFVR